MRSDQSDLSSLFCSLDLEGRIQILFLLESDPDFPWVGILRFDFDVSAVFFSLHGRDIFSLRIFCELRLLFLVYRVYSCGLHLRDEKRKAQFFFI